MILIVGSANKSLSISIFPLSAATCKGALLNQLIWNYIKKIIILKISWENKKSNMIKKLFILESNK